MKNISPLPVTNLLGHQQLLAWYDQTQKLGDKILCPLLATIPAQNIAKLLPCDCTDSRKHYLALRSRCYRGKQCLPRQTWQWPNSIVGNELQEYYRRG